MMTGIVSADLEARLALRLQSGSEAPEIQAVIDTGFTGFLTLPSSLIVKLNLPWLCRQEGQLADGSLHAFDVYCVTVAWDGIPTVIEVEAADAEPLIGMEMLRGYELRMIVKAGGSVTVSKEEASEVQ
jgi:clan AA aspartic protease